MTDYVVDSFALIAYIQAEPFSTRIEELIEEVRTGQSRLEMSVVNVCEALYTMQRRQGAGGVVGVLNRLNDLPIEIVEVDLPLAISAAQIKAVTPIALGDCFAIALALQRSATVLTGDPEFAQVQGLVNIEWLQR